MKAISHFLPLASRLLPLASRLLPLALISLLSCSSPTPDAGGEMSYARWLTMTDTTATVLNPWHEGEVLHTYRLPDEGKGYDRAVSGTSLHAFLAYRLGAMDRVAGVMDAEYIVAPELKAALTKNQVMGSSQSPNLERIRGVGCDLIFASPFENAGYGTLETLGVPIVECADYMEESPLGRAEWMRFYGRLLGCGERADSLFCAEETAYRELCTTEQPAERKAERPAEGTAEQPAQRTAEQPSVLLGKRSGQSWYVPGGRSYLGRLLSDAGTRYVFAHEDTTGSVPLDFEAVFARARDADLWIFTYAAPPDADGHFAHLTSADLLDEDERYGQFRAFKEHHIWVCNTLEVPYYDALPWAPAALLRDIILIAHPERFPGERPTYFYPLE